MIGRRHRLAAGPLLVLAASLAQPQPAAAQVSSFLDGLFGRKEQPAPAPDDLKAMATAMLEMAETINALQHRVHTLEHQVEFLASRAVDTVTLGEKAG